MDLAAGFGFLLAFVAVAVTVTPGLSNGWAAILCWTITVLYAAFLFSTHRTAILQVINHNRAWTTFSAIVLGAVVIGGAWFNFILPLAARAQLSTKNVVTDVASADQVKALLDPAITNVAYRELVAEVIHSMEPLAHISVGGQIIGPDGALSVDVQVWPQSGVVSGPTVIDVIDRPDGQPVGIRPVDMAESRRRDIRATATLICSNTGFAPIAISKAKRTGVGLISVLKAGDKRIGTVIEEEIYLRRIKLAGLQQRYEVAKFQPGVRRSSDPALKEHDLKYRGASLDAWLEARLMMGIGGITANGPITFFYRLKKPTNFTLPNKREMRITQASISTDIAIQWLSQVVRLDASNAIYDYVRGRVRLGSGENKYVISGVDWNKATPISEPPPMDALSFGLLPGEIQLMLMDVEGAPIGAKGSPEIDALIEPEDLKSDPLPIMTKKAN